MGLEMRVVVVGGGCQLEGDRRVFTRVTAMLYALYLSETLVTWVHTFVKLNLHLRPVHFT